MASWFFSEKGINDKERDPGWDEYFSSNRSTVESLVRESIQNSLDAAAKKNGSGTQALVRIMYSGVKNALPESDYEEYLNGAAEHYAAKDCGLSSVSGPCPYFVIEDFNTDGLTGDILAENEDEPYFKFLKCENKSTKNEEGASTLGKWGIGKVVFPIASRLRTFFAYSIRGGSSADATHPREVLVGECLLRYHTVDGVRYTPDGWWGGERNTDGRNRPAAGEQDASDIATFKSRFGLTRKDEPGLSVVVPYVEDISVDELKRSIVENYMVAKGPSFVALVYPAALRNVLEYTFLLHHDGQGYEWADDWRLFAKENLGVEYPALSGKPAYDEQDLQDWIDAVVESFVSGADLVKKLNGGEQ